MLHDVDQAATRAAAMVEAGAIFAVSGKRVKVDIDSICVHGDTPGAVAMSARRPSARPLQQAGVTLRPFAARRFGVIGGPRYLPAGECAA